MNDTRCALSRKCIQVVNSQLTLFRTRKKKNNLKKQQKTKSFEFWHTLRALQDEGPERNAALGGIHNQSYLQFQIRYRNRFGVVRKRKIRASKCSRF
eukprot:sb/3479007/